MIDGFFEAQIWEGKSKFSNGILLNGSFFSIKMNQTALVCKYSPDNLQYFRNAGNHEKKRKYFQEGP